MDKPVETQTSNQNSQCKLSTIYDNSKKTFFRQPLYVPQPYTSNSDNDICVINNSLATQINFYWLCITNSHAYISKQPYRNFRDPIIWITFACYSIALNDHLIQAVLARSIQRISNRSCLQKRNESCRKKYIEISGLNRWRN